MHKLRRIAPIVLLVALFAFMAAGCSKDVNATFDTTTCIYDHNTQRLIKQVLPGANRVSVDKKDDTVTLPESNRFFRASSDGQKDALAPDYYIAYAKGHVPVRVEGQIHFRFKVDSACDWYAAHGRRNEPLLFNARGPGQKDTGWARWLGENFAGTMSQVAKDSSSGYTWQELVYGNEGATSTSGTKTPSDPISVSYGKLLGQKFTARLPQNIGGSYFCGTDKNLTGGGDCPAMYFEVTRVVTDDPSLMTSQSAVAQQQQAASVANNLAESRKQTNAKLIEAETLKQKLLAKQIETARLSALADQATQKCLIFAQHKLDCDGHFANAGNVTVNSNKP